MYEASPDSSCVDLTAVANSYNCNVTSLSHMTASFIFISLPFSYNLRVLSYLYPIIKAYFLLVDCHHHVLCKTAFLKVRDQIMA